MSDSGPMQRVRALVAPIVADLKLDLYDLEFRGGVLRITIDTPPGSEGGVTLESIALVTRLLSRELDHDDPMPGHYTLEVTSPGLERQLRLPAHFQRELGKTVSVRLRDATHDARRFQGVLVAATDTEATIRLDELDAEGSFVDRIVPYTQIDRAKTVFIWEKAPKPSEAPKKKPASKKPATKKETSA
ncbi:MAG: ribosome maturation factor RimP [Actinobacteria bacterium]|nr:ribosome maturation factor RimP [Actinomycetota bacterium]